MQDILHIPRSRQSPKELHVLGLCGTVQVDANLAMLLQPYITNPPQHLNRYGRLIIKSMIYHGTIYEKPEKFNNTAISYTLPSSHDEHVKSFGVISLLCLRTSMQL